MKNNIKYFFIPAILVIVALLLFVTLSNDTKKVHLKNFDETVSYIQNGWVPDNLPKNSKNINLSYDLDSNVVNGKFVLDNATDVASFKSSLTKLEDPSSYDFRHLNNEFKKLVSQISSNKYSNDVFVYQDFVFVHKDGSEFYFLSNGKA